MGIDQLADFFKPEIRKRGQAEFESGVVVISQASDSQILAYVERKLKVSLQSSGITSSSLTAQCSCSLANKNQLCRHVWAVMMATAAKAPDFLELKTAVEKSATLSSAKNEEYKSRRAEYRSRQYQKQKQQLKDRKQKAKEKLTESEVQKIQYPDDIAQALAFFSENGFPFEQAFNEEELRNAWRKLSRIFHPDRGGTHDEAVVLNENYQTLIQFLLA